jgi:phytoene desaturase
MKKALVIGAGFSGLSVATTLASQGFDVTILEKNNQAGGRARQYEHNGFVFDMGPSWYWMPDVFDDYFRRFGKSVADYYNLIRLDPGYRVFFPGKDTVDVSASMEAIYATFEHIEKGSAQKLKRFLDEAAYKYEVGMKDLVFKPGLSVTEFADTRVLKGLLRLQLLKNIRSYIHREFADPRLRQLLEFPILFLGALPQNTPALYSLMNYADLKLGTWYPMGGMHEIIKAMVALAKENGVTILTGKEVTHFEFNAKGKITAAVCDQETFYADVVVASADYHHIDQNVLPADKRSYSPQYWDKRKMAPSALLYYVGVKGRVEGLQHHNLFFDRDFDNHADQIYANPAWPNEPLFYLSAPSLTDPSVAPPDHENLFFLIPVAPGLEDTPAVRDRYFEVVLQRLKDRTGIDLADRIVYKATYAHADFVRDYHAFKGNAYGLANTLDQTAILKPRVRSKKISNLYYTGQLTSPGPGIPPSIISGQVVGDLIAASITQKTPTHEAVV